MQIFEFSVSSTDKPCGETNVRLNGQPLESQWEGNEANGRGFLDVYSQHEAAWSITCLSTATSSDGDIPDESNAVHLFRLRFGEAAEGFTISYNQAREAAIIRFSPHVVPEAEAISMAREWRQPSIEFDHDLLMNSQIEDEPKTLSNRLWQGSQKFLSSVSAFQGRLKETLITITGCHKNKAHASHSQPSPVTLIPYLPVGEGTAPGTERSHTPSVPDTSPPDKSQSATDDADLETFKIENDPPSENQIAGATSLRLASTNTLLHHSAAETRSIHAPGEVAYPSPTTETSSTTFAPATELNYRRVKIFGLTLIILSLVAWCVLRCKDPRWRAERAARREEQRTKRLYKLAARKHKIKTFFGNLRTRFLRITLVGTSGFGLGRKTDRNFRK